MSNKYREIIAQLKRCWSSAYILLDSRLQCVKYVCIKYLTLYPAFFQSTAFSKFISKNFLTGTGLSGLTVTLLPMEQCEG